MWPADRLPAVIDLDLTASGTGCVLNESDLMALGQAQQSRQVTGHPHLVDG
jgi:hypothetical protein